VGGGGGGGGKGAGRGKEEGGREKGVIIGEHKAWATRAEHERKGEGAPATRPLFQPYFTFAGKNRD